MSLFDRLGSDRNKRLIDKLVVPKRLVSGARNLLVRNHPAPSVRLGEKEEHGTRRSFTFEAIPTCEEILPPDRVSASECVLELGEPRCRGVSPVQNSL
jgi:hypothetical protein